MVGDDAGADVNPDGRQAHWVRPNDATRQPKCFVLFDTESRVHVDERGPTQVWRCGVAVHVHRREAIGQWRPDEWAEFDKPADLWEWVIERALSGVRLVLVAHNLAFDLRIADAFRELGDRGWRLDRIRLDGDQTSVRWRKGTRTILGVDSLSWWPVALDRLGDDVGRRKPRLPAPGASDDQWLARCRADVAILRDAWVVLITWLREWDAGTWQPTGAAQAWSAWRHRFYTHRVLVDDDDDVRELEREATWTGRCEAWRHGRLRAGPYHEWDYQASYMQIASEAMLPTRVVGKVDRPTLGECAKWATTSCVLVSVTVTTDVPILPARSARGVYWPVGTFRTTVWWPELAAAIGAGSTCVVDRAVIYSAAPILKAFADWCLPIVNDDAGDLDPVVRRLIKHWSRALIGRFGVRYRTWQPFGDAIDNGVFVADAFDVDTGERYRVLHAGDRVLREGELIEGENAVPSVMGAIMSAARVQLWETMLVAGLEHVVYVDTDGLIVDAEGDARLEAAGLAGLRRKAAYRSVQIWGPRQCVFGAELRIAGVPRRAKRVGPNTFEGEVWPALGTSLGRGESSSVRVVPRRVSIKGVDHRRQHLPGGLTAPMVATGD